VRPNDKITPSSVAVCSGLLPLDHPFECCMLGEPGLHQYAGMVGHSGTPTAPAVVVRTRLTPQASLRIPPGVPK
jgi:hypothetical protein